MSILPEYQKILELADDGRIKLAEGFKDSLHTELCLGMTRYVCRFGTLGDGHDKYTPAQRYYQAIKEMWTRASTVSDLKAQAMEAQAELLDAQQDLAISSRESEVLRAKAKELRAINMLRNALVSLEDTMRQVDEFNKVRLELMDEVRTQYPLGIEQAEPDNWKTTAIARQAHGMASGQLESMKNIPLPPAEKAYLGNLIGRPDMTVPHSMIADFESVKKLIEVKR